MTGRSEFQGKYPAIGTVILLALTIIGMLLACVLILPKNLVDRSIGRDQSKELSPTDRLKAENDIRTTSLQAVAGILLLLGASIGAIVTLRQVRVNREGQITDRFTHAIDQLGNENVDVRVGGIYALERIARDSASDRDGIFEVLASFIRRKSQFEPSPKDENSIAPYSIYSSKALRVRSADVQAALIVLTRSPLSEGRRFSTLDALDFRGAVLPGAQLNQVSLVGIHLEGSWLRNANFQKSSLTQSYLSNSVLEGADFSSANLDRADLRGADLTSANLTEASLIGADMTGAKLMRADLRGAKANGSTSWPEGFRPEAADVVLM